MNWIGCLTEIKKSISIKHYKLFFSSSELNADKNKLDTYRIKTINYKQKKRQFINNIIKNKKIKIIQKNARIRKEHKSS